MHYRIVCLRLMLVFIFEFFLNSKQRSYAVAFDSLCASFSFVLFDFVCVCACECVVAFVCWLFKANQSFMWLNRALIYSKLTQCNT